MLYAFYFVYVIRMRLICNLMSRVCHPYIIRVWLVRTHMSFVCYPYVLACHPYVTCICLHLIRMSLAWTHSICMYLDAILMSLVCTRISSICHYYVLLCHSYITFMYSDVICTSPVCTRISFECRSYVVLLWIEQNICFSIDYVDIHIEWNILWKTTHFSKQRNAFFFFIYLVIL